MKSPNGLKNMNYRNSQDPYKRLAMQVFLDAIRKIRADSKRMSIEQVQKERTRELRFLKYGVGGSPTHPPPNAGMFHEMIGMEWLMEMDEDRILELVTQHRIPKSWRKEGLL